MEFQPLKLFLFLSFPLTLSHFSSFEDPDMKKKNWWSKHFKKNDKKKNGWKPIIAVPWTLLHR